MCSSTLCCPSMDQGSATIHHFHLNHIHSPIHPQSLGSVRSGFTSVAAAAATMMHSAAAPVQGAHPRRICASTGPNSIFNQIGSPSWNSAIIQQLQAHAARPFSPLSCSSKSPAVSGWFSSAGANTTTATNTRRVAEHRHEALAVITVSVFSVSY